jgi:hypothetical protein
VRLDWSTSWWSFTVYNLCLMNLSPLTD